jgi:gliding motility-associated lipoprotein GldH
MPRILFVALLGMLFAGCQPQHIFHAYQDLPGQVWPVGAPASFQFSIETPAEYALSYHVRNTRDYPFYNLYVKYEILDAQGVLVRQQIHETNLMHPQTGVPLGNGESIYDHSIPAIKHRFEQPGTYQFRISQYMRVDTLQGIQAIGFTVDK